MAIFGILTLIFWLILWTYWLISAFRANKSVHNRPWWVRTIGIRMALLVIVIIAIYTGHGGTFGNFLKGFLSRPAEMLSTNMWLGLLGVILCGAGIAFAIWARVYLGRNWGMPMTLREKPELVTSGPYKFVRHPIYTGFLLAMIGTILTDGWIWFVILIIAGIYFIYSAKTEEKMMAVQFPNEYPEYMKRTKMLIPFVL
jgi:protein-S-isoprenylcysteine O-methyltransferase Ste14